MIMDKNKKFYKKNETDTIIWVESENTPGTVFYILFLKGKKDSK